MEMVGHHDEVMQPELFGFCVFTARLKPCPDTCMVDGCGVAMHADVGCLVSTQRTIKKRKIGRRVNFLPQIGPDERELGRDGDMGMISVKFGTSKKVVHGRDKCQGMT